MKKIYVLAAMATVLTFSSCEDFMDIHKEYIKGGEIVYAPKPDSISFVAGKKRIEFYCRTYNASNVRSIDVYWNSRRDSLIIPVKMTTGYDHITAMLDNMEEKPYTFEVQATDNFGNKSLMVSDFGTSYGEIYQSTLNNRRIKKMIMDEYSAYIQWYTAPAGLVRTEVRYERNDGTKATLWVPRDRSEFGFIDAKAGSSVEYRSLYIPEEESVDTFSTVWTTSELTFPMEYKLSPTTWTIVAVSDEDAEHGRIGKNILDDNVWAPSFWESRWGTINAPLPHWIVVDMKLQKNVARLHVYRRPNGDTKSVEVYISDTPDPDGEWVKIAEGSYINSSVHDISLFVPDSINAKGRYIKLLLPDSNRAPFISVAEFYVYGR